MRILFLNEAPLIRYGLAEGFKQLGCDVYILMGENDRLWGKSAEDQVSLINKKLDEIEPDLIFVEGFCGIAINQVYPVFRERKIPFFYWAIEDPVATSLSDAHIPYADYIFTTTVERVSHYHQYNKPSEVLLFACNPEVHRNMGIHEEYKHDIVLVGANYSSRYEEAEWFVMPLIEAGYDVKIWGVWWDDLSRPVNLGEYPEVYQGILPYEELAKVYSSAKIILGMNCDNTSITQTSMRPYEVAGCGGGIYLGHYTKAVKHVFEDKLLQVRNTVATKYVIDRLLNNWTDVYIARDVERKIQEAQKFVYERHTYKHRAQQIIKVYNRMYL